MISKILLWLKDKSSHNNDKSNPEKTIVKSDLTPWIRPTTVSIASIGYAGQVSKSPSGEFSISWGDAEEYESNNKIGKYTGLYVLLRHNTVVAVIPGRRPLEAVVADDGTFVVHDCAAGNAVAHSVIAYDKEGAEIYRRNFKRNPYRSWISHDGTYFAIQTANGTKGASMFAFFNLKERREIFCRFNDAWVEKIEYHDGFVKVDGGRMDYDGNWIS